MDSAERLDRDSESERRGAASAAPRRVAARNGRRPRRAALEAQLLTALRPSAGHEETLRLLIGVLARDPGEIERLHERTILPLARYDAEHDTDLVATVRAFLANDGSTSVTAEALGLHRHTVGFRLTRVYEISGLSPYASDGRERLSLGLKAADLLAAWRR